MLRMVIDTQTQIMNNPALKRSLVAEYTICNASGLFSMESAPQHISANISEYRFPPHVSDLTCARRSLCVKSLGPVQKKIIELPFSAVFVPVQFLG